VRARAGGGAAHCLAARVPRQAPHGSRGSAARARCARPRSLQASAPARVVVQSSMMHQFSGDIPFEDLNSRKNPWRARSAHDWHKFGSCAPG
jgi:hypothetical protein